MLTGLLLAACGEAEQPPAAAAPPPAVSVVEVQPQNVTPSAQFVGRVVSIEQVDLRARHFEQPPFQAQLDEAKADLARAEASVAETKATLERVQQAVKSGAVSTQELDQDTAKAEKVQAQVLIAWTIAPVRPILAHHANESCAKQRIGCADAPRLITGRISGTDGASRRGATGPQ